MTMDPKKKFEDLLHQSLEKVHQGEESIESMVNQYPDHAEDLRESLEASLWLTDKRELLDPRPGFVAVSRKRIVEQIQAEGSPSFWSSFQLIFRKPVLQWVPVLILLFVFFAASGGLTAMAVNALPGDSMYSMKINIEKTRLFFVQDEVKAIELHIGFAQNRLDEIEKLLFVEHYEEVEMALENYADHVEQAGSLIVKVADRLPKEANRLALLLIQTTNKERQIITVAVIEKLPAGARASAAAVVEVMTSIETMMVGVVPTDPTKPSETP
jgi:hypothetical protein